MRMRRIVPLGGPDDITRAGKRGNERARRVADGEAAYVVEMQVRGEDDVDGVAADARVGKRVIEVARAVDRVDLDALRVHLAANSRIDEERFLPLGRLSLYEQRTESEPDAVPLVGRRAFLPQRLRHHAEHGSAVEAEAAIPQRGSG